MTVLHLRLVRDVPRPKPAPRPAKVVQLEARRRARLDALRKPHTPRPAA
jgi:hypothetical protein